MENRVEHAHARAHRASFRPHTGYFIGILLFAAVFASIVLSGFHSPRPHALPVGVVAPASVTKQVEAGLDKALPDGFDVQVYPSEAAAQTALAHGALDGALVDSSGHLQLLLSEAQGTAPTSAVTNAFNAFAAKSGHPLTVTDAVPPRPNDSLALSPFFIILSVVFPSIAAGVLSALLFRRARPGWAVAAPIMAATGIGLVGAAIADGLAGLGNYPALAGVVALFSLAVAAPTAVLSRIKPPLAALSLLVFVILGLPDSGGPGGMEQFDPAWMRHLHPALPLGLAADSVRRIVYFGGNGTASLLWVLGVWAGVGVLALGLVTKWRQAQARRAGMAVTALTDESAVAADSAPAVLAEYPVGHRQSVDGSPALPGSGGGVVVGFDNSVPARRALGQAARLAAATNQVLHVVYADHVIIESDMFGVAYTEMHAARDEEAAKVAEAAAEISAQAGVAHTFERSQSAPSDAILHAAGALVNHEQDVDHDGSGPVIVVGRSGHGASHLLGSVPTHLLAHSAFPVLAIP